MRQGLTSPGASYVQTDGASSVVQINADRCITCGACFALCDHGARDYRDDTDAFFADLKRGEPITLLLAPAFRAAYPEEYGAILGGLYEEDRMLCAIQRIRTESKRDDPDSPWNPRHTPEKRLALLNRQFGSLSLSHYLRRFVNRSGDCDLRIPTEEEADRIFNEMHKRMPESREINCSACGYDNCHEMMVAIYNGFNTRQSCIHYDKDEAIRLERLSMNDPLTGVMNRSGLQNVLANQYRNKPLAVIAVDINGLKETNDTLGHEAGDRLIVDVAACMSSVFGSKRVFRTGGDEFIVILQDYTEAECLEGIRHLRGTMAERGVSAAVGYAYSDCYDSGFAGMQAIADKRMYEDKDRYYRETGKKRR